MAEQFDVVVSGYLCLAFFPDMLNTEPQALIVPGRLVEVGHMEISPGGPVWNTGLALHKLGVKVKLIACVGDDPLGKITLDQFSKYDKTLAYSIHIEKGYPSSYSVVLSPKRADRTFWHCAGTNQTFGVDSINYESLTGAKLFHLGYPPLLPSLLEDDGEGLFTVYRRVKALGVVTSMDTVVPDPTNISGKVNWPNILKKTLPNVDKFLPSIDEILFMLRYSDWKRWQGEVLSHINADYLLSLAEELLELGTVVAGFKLGAKGIYLRTSSSSHFQRLAILGLDVNPWVNKTLWQPAFQVEVRGTTGAGDSAYAGFLTALLYRQNPEVALRWACAVGACNVEAVSGITDLQSVLARLQAGWQVRPDQLVGFRVS